MNILSFVVRMPARRLVRRAPVRARETLHLFESKHRPHARDRELWLCLGLGDRCDGRTGEDLLKIAADHLIALGDPG